MDNLVEFEESSVFISSTIGLGVFDILLFLNHIIVIINLSKEKLKLESLFEKSSCIHIFAQLIFSSLFFTILHRTHLANSVFLILSNLIGITLTLEWLCLYLYFYHKDKLILAIIHILLPISLVIIILCLCLMMGEVNKTIEVVLINITFLFYVLMFISSGSNTINLFKKGNPEYISITNSIIGIFVNIFMSFFIIMLSYYKIISLAFITYSIISLIICILQVIYYFEKIKEYKNSDSLTEKLDNEDNNKDKVNSLINNEYIES